MLKKFFCLLNIMILTLVILNLCSLNSAQADQLLPTTAVEMSAQQNNNQPQEQSDSCLTEPDLLTEVNDLPVLPNEVSKRLFAQDAQLLQPQSIELPSSPEDYLQPGPWDYGAGSSEWGIPSQNEEIVTLVAEITNGIDSDSERALAIYQWVTENITYDYSFTYYYAMETLHNRTGVCNGYALLLAAMMRAGGIPCKHVVGAVNTWGIWPDHAWNEIYIDGQWYSVDATWDSGRKYNYYYLIDEKTFSEDHHKILVNIDLTCVYNGQDLNLELTTSGSDKGEKIYYTLDGTTPTVNSAVYDSPISIHDKMGFKAIMVVPQGVVSWLGIPFDSLGKILRFELKGDNVEIIRYLGNEENVIIPDTISGFPVIGIGERAFYDCAELTSITLPQGVTNIGNEAFSGCKQLASITIPEGVASIGWCAFFDCTNLTNIALPSTLISIPSAFYNCTSLTSITFNSATTTIDDSFSTIPEQATIIGYDPSTAKDYSELYGRMFAVTGSPEPPKAPDWSIDVSDGVAAILDYKGDQCFVTIPDTFGGYPVTSIYENAFYYCKSLTSIIIPKGIASIDNGAFYGCTGLTSITFSSATTTIDDGWNTIPYQATIIGYDPSTAKDYATNNYRTFEAITLQSIAITTPAAKTSYTVGDPLDITELVVTGTYSHSITKAEPLTVANVTGFDSSSVATEQVLTITVGKKTVTYEVNILEKPVDECFIATAAFGSKFEPAVVLLRHFRDEYLLTNSLGTAFVKFYYHNSPPIAAYIAHSEPLKVLVRIMLIPVIAATYSIMNPGVGAGCVILLSLVLAVRKRRKKALRA